MCESLRSATYCPGGESYPPTSRGSDTWCRGDLLRLRCVHLGGPWLEPCAQGGPGGDAGSLRPPKQGDGRLVCSILKWPRWNSHEFHVLQETSCRVPFTPTPGWADRRAGQALTGFGPESPRAVTTGWPSRWVRASPWPWGPRQALCAVSPAPRATERSEGIHLSRQPASYLGPRSPEQEPKAQSACGLVSRMRL